MQVRVGLGADHHLATAAERLAVDHRFVLAGARILESGRLGRRGVGLRIAEGLGRRVADRHPPVQGHDVLRGGGGGAIDHLGEGGVALRLDIRALVVGQHLYVQQQRFFDLR